MKGLKLGGKQDFIIFLFFPKFGIKFPPPPCDQILVNYLPVLMGRQT